MEKTIEEQIAEGVAKGIEQAQKNSEKKKIANNIQGIFLFVISFFFAISLIVIFKENKHLKDIVFFGSSVFIFMCFVFFQKEYFKEHKIFSLIVSCMGGFLFMQMV